MRLERETEVPCDLLGSGSPVYVSGSCACRLKQSCEERMRKKILTTSTFRSEEEELGW
jgi:hypothetical protein